MAASAKEADRAELRAVKHSAGVVLPSKEEWDAAND